MSRGRRSVLVVSIMFKSFSSLLTRDEPLIRLLALWIVCAFLFIFAWLLSYYFLREGILRRRFLSANLPLETSQVFSTFLRIFATNLVVGVGLILVASLFLVGNMPMSYFVVGIHAVFYGMFLGTNSFTIPAASRLPPSLSNALNRSGAFEITAYIAVAAATKNLALWRQQSWINWHADRIAGPNNWDLTALEKLLLMGAILLLAGANYREALQIHAIL